MSSPTLFYFMKFRGEGHKEQRNTSEWSWAWERDMKLQAKPQVSAGILACHARSHARMLIHPWVDFDQTGVEGRQQLVRNNGVAVEVSCKDLLQK